jgi:hypothetical protein
MAALKAPLVRRSKQKYHLAKTRRHARAWHRIGPIRQWLSPIHAKSAGKNHVADQANKRTFVTGCAPPLE